MKLLVATDAHIFRTPDGKHWCKAIYSYSFWTRYLAVFDSVRIVAREKNVDEVPDKCISVDGEGVEVFGIPFYQGPKQLLKKYLPIKKRLKNAFDGCDCALFRLPSQTAQMAFEAKPKNMPFAGEIVYNPGDDSKNTNRSLFLRTLSYITSKKLAYFCRTANGVSYVTQDVIQKNFPSYCRLKGEDELHFESSYSTINLPEEAFTGERTFADKEELVLVLSSVAMNSERKGERVLINALAKVRQRGYNVKAVIIGDGSKRHEFEMLSESLGLKDAVDFVGLLPTPEDVRKILVKSDVYILPTRGEGLPRGILEAMALGMPVISTPVGGIPEVIDRKYLFDPMDVDGFSDAICRLCDNKQELDEMSKNNYEKSLEFKADLLQKRRNEFYLKLKNLVK